MYAHCGAVFAPGLCSFPVLQQYFEIIYQGDKAGKAFHAKVNKDQNAKFSPWVEGTRKAEFSMPVNVPAMLKKMIGECQHVPDLYPRRFTPRPLAAACLQRTNCMCYNWH